VVLTIRRLVASCCEQFNLLRIAANVAPFLVSYARARRAVDSTDA
jgi:hypothetical protein